MKSYVKVEPVEMNGEHDTVRSRLTGKLHEISFGPLPAHSDPKLGGLIAFNPFHSKAQMKKFFVMEKEGKIPKGTAEHWAHETPNISKLPQHKRKG